ncbi:phage head completion protein [Rhizobium panacihumi]|uniref:phage head completion protein n=1 Tax=Rhizobium panacihumi TaxID=2008450 RepID=UPI003D79201B
MVSAGELKERVAFDEREQEKGEGGNWQHKFVERFQRRAKFVYAGGGESIMAERLQGKSTMKVRLRKDSSTRAITADWQMRDVRLGTVYAIREVDAVTVPGEVYLVVSSGGAS